MRLLPLADLSPLLSLNLSPISALLSFPTHHLCYPPAPPAAALVITKRCPHPRAGVGWGARAAASLRKLTPRPAAQQQLVALHPALGPHPPGCHMPAPCCPFPHCSSDFLLTLAALSLLPQLCSVLVSPRPVPISLPSLHLFVWSFCCLQLPQAPCCDAPSFNPLPTGVPAPEYRAVLPPCEDRYVRTRWSADHKLSPWVK